MTVITAVKSWTNSGLSLFSHELTVALVVVVTIPFILHGIFFRSGRHKPVPSILLLGPSNSGKTSFLARLEHGPSTKTHTSQVTTSVELFLPSDRTVGSNNYRSINDPSRNDHCKFQLVDTPGHEKIRHNSLQNITNLPNLRGIIFFVDSSRIKTDKDCLRTTTVYLYDILLFLKRKAEEGNYSKEIQVLIAASKMDLFTAIPAAYVQKTLEHEISRLRDSKLNGLLDTDIASGHEAEGLKDDWIGEKGSNVFQFSQMKELDNISVEICGGHVIGEEAQIERWLSWISERI
ncbi:Signal recognition particle receptor subunit beta [Golovinomyces cichoracearum]|uniref:Signal recognition particle receptor subunit beta n=1 Tax=Golovinomyces cichoracearum TaxID=62708 RepID=A0A420HFF3_9PEZI|nr:Signal recognition particle receptor subunit beta [Golovinomyces cichoracearum]